MTRQISDTLWFEQQRYHVCGVDGGLLFDPSEVGIANPGPRNTACWRGFHCEFALGANGLKLQALAVYLNEGHPLLTGVDDSPPFGMLPQIALGEETHFFGFDARWTDLDHRIEFTGGILFGSEFEQKFHTMEARGWEFRVVKEATLVSGAAVKVRDLSEIVARIRDAYLRRDANRAHAEREVSAGIQAAFPSDRDYSFNRLLQIIRAEPEWEAQRQQKERRAKEFLAARDQRRTCERPRIEAASVELLLRLPEVKDGATLEGHCARCGIAGTVRVRFESLVMCGRCFADW